MAKRAEDLQDRDRETPTRVLRDRAAALSSAPGAKAGARRVGDHLLDRLGCRA